MPGKWKHISNRVIMGLKGFFSPLILNKDCLKDTHTQEKTKDAFVCFFFKRPKLIAAFCFCLKTREFLLFTCLFSRI